ncbi:inverse autotransporter beta domain-containing protein [Pelosinus baikalensis]|uniref:Inverse autotransporter beta domain-containing protein n=1 Tax=Pelosinus baikalensis TaxID=2892015 RepID=A0ABS8HSW0_9FIRM|nr:inverse autotransporter beta domain-containing protein [Pelosinus baikalensis]MCC5466265.1 inverse autotransporter beta domain-containing protein [Pelosinus baikalensis]
MRKIISILMLLSIMLQPIGSAEEVSVEDGLTRVGNSYIVQGIQDFKRNEFPIWLQRTDIGFRFQTDGTPIYSIETIQPIGVPSDQITNFTQFRLGNDLSAGTVANLILGRRIFSADKTSMYTVNTFYDHGFKYGHGRVGGGLEYANGRNKYQANMYYNISGEKMVDPSNAIYERALSGYDYSVGTTFAYAPWAQVYIKGYSWDYNNSIDDVDFKIYTQLQVTPRLNIEFGYLDDNGGEHYGKIFYSLGHKGPAMIEKGKRIFRSEDEKTVLATKSLEKVQRKNDIYVE